MARRQLTHLASAALVLAQVSPAFAQTREAAPQPAPAAEPAPSTRQARPPATRPAPPPSRPRPPSGGDWHWNQPGYPPPNWGGWGSNGWGSNWQSWNGGYNRLRCESTNGRYRRCNANTQGRAAVMRTLSNTRCRQGYSWGFNRSHIWVSNGCRAEFAYGFGNSWGGSSGGGTSAGDVIAGVAIAGGLIALLAAANRSGASGSSQPSAPAPGGGSGGALPYPPNNGPARIVADFSALPAAAQAPARTCMNGAAQQIGATGGSTVTWTRTLGTEPGNGGYRFNVALRADYPDGPRNIAMYCRATPDRVVQLDFAALAG